LIPHAERLQLLQRFLRSHPKSGEPHAVSALNGEGVADLMSAIVGALVPASPALGSAVPFANEQVEAIPDARVAIFKRNTTAANKLLRELL
jgi:hypothetical protein